MENRLDQGLQRSRYRFDHVGLTVPDIDHCLEFFTANFDAEVVFTLERFFDESGEASSRLGAPPHASFAIAMLRIGGTEVELLQWWPSIPGEPTPHSIGAAHLALSVPDVAATYERLCAVPGVRRLGAPITFSGTPTDGLTNAFVATPWGLLVELMEWPGPGA